MTCYFHFWTISSHRPDRLGNDVFMRRYYSPPLGRSGQLEEGDLDEFRFQNWVRVTACVPEISLALQPPSSLACGVLNNLLKHLQYKLYLIFQRSGQGRFMLDSNSGKSLHQLFKKFIA